MSPNSQRLGASDAIDVRDLLDPDLRDVLGTFEIPPFDAETIAAIRNAPFPGMALSDAVERTEHEVPGDPPIPVRVHRPVGADGALPGIFSIHGGGYVIGSYDMDDHLHDQWSPLLGTVGISVQYRLAPETPYPGPVEDCYAALRWAHEHADEIGVDPARLGTYGISAGGGLAAALALLVRDRGEFPSRFSCWTARCLMIARRRRPSERRASTSGAPSRTNSGWRSYLGERYGSDDVPPYAAASRATTLAGLPPSCVVVGSIDGFRDEDVDYALRLNQAGVPCELHVIAGLPHAYQMAPDSQAVQLATQCKDDWLARQLAQLATG